jgi:hypothetical protein
MSTSALAIMENSFLEPVREWPEISTQTALKPLPVFPLGAMPGILQAMTTEISESVQVQPESAGLALLIIAAAAAGRENIYSIKNGLDTRPNLFGLFFVERGGRKSSSYTPALAPVQKWIIDHVPDHRKAMSRYFLKTRERESLESKICKPGNSTGAADELRRETLQAEIDRMKADLRDPAFIADDCTPEGLFELFDRTQGQAAIFSDDGRTFAKILKGIYNGGESREDLHLRGYDCKNPIVKHRAGKASSIIQKPFENALVMLQTDFLHKFAESEDLFQSGFMSRCIFCFPDSMAGTRGYTEREISATISREYSELITSLLNQNYYRRIDNDKVYQLDPDAKTLWIEYYNKIETAIGEGGELSNMADIAIRFPEFCRKFALLMPIVEGRENITGADMARAIALTEYFQIHAERSFSVMKKISLPDEARRTLKAIHKNRLQEFTSRDIHRLTGMTAEQSEAGINALASRNYCRLKADQPETDGAGRKPSPVYESNPEIFKAAT